MHCQPVRGRFGIETVSNCAKTRYLDPPYFFENQKDFDYRDVYHFLEGLVDYRNWRELIDWNTVNLRLNGAGMRWPTKSRFALKELYENLINEFSESIIVVSHKSGSVVSVGQIEKMLLDRGKKVKKKRKRYKYALSKHNGKPRKNIEWLIIGV